LSFYAFIQVIVEACPSFRALPTRKKKPMLFRWWVELAVTLAPTGVPISRLDRIDVVCYLNLFVRRMRAASQLFLQVLTLARTLPPTVALISRQDRIEVCVFFISLFGVSAYCVLNVWQVLMQRASRQRKNMLLPWSAVAAALMTGNSNQVSL
jgi:hypothetical protein